ncbi:MAG: phosphoserine phosphatase RsbU/P, partial [Micromonosporaceae bacterium]|nr:phosphoserine phosphatase RsbU/P [Micromonosporaceae bacterium]
MRSVSQLPAANVRAGFRSRVKNFWQRVSEGRQIDDLWNQFAADARAGYGFYGRDVDWEKIGELRRWRRPLHVAKQFFWVLLVKLAPVRRVLLLVALVLLVLTRFALFGGVLLFVLLLLELADKVTMK